MQTVVRIRRKTHRFDPDWTKAKIARYLLAEDDNYTLTEISQAVPMAYSQVHSIAKAEGLTASAPPPAAKKPQAQNTGEYDQKKMLADIKTLRGPEPKPMRSGKYHRGSSGRLTEEEATTWEPPPRAKASKKTKPKIGKLRTPGLPSDIDVGACANCGHDIVVRQGGAEGYLLVHTNISAEEHLSTTQFCHAVPTALLSL